MAKTYSSKRVTDLVPGLTFRMLDYYARVGMVDPAEPGVGSGSRRRFNLQQMLRLRAIMLHAQAFPKVSVHSFATHIRELDAANLADSVMYYPTERVQVTIDLWLDPKTEAELLSITNGDVFADLVR